MRSIQFITHQNDCIGYAEGAKMALEGGCKWIQLRMKDATDDEVRSVAAEIHPLCKQNEAIFLLDDRVELARELHADGVHLGKNDMPVDEARRVLGEEFIIGGTANTFEDIERLASQGADYIGCGPFRFTTTKKNLAPVLGLEGYRDIIDNMRRAGIDIPVVAIGGITASDIDDILATGVKGIAVSGSVLTAENPVAMMRTLINGE
ncbi:MAG: thiamine phosphate synthase [Prevotella sp.]|nr:thiamine phosphate synthase [Prevotella sp.]